MNQTNTRILKIAADRRKIINKCLAILATSVARIKKQGCGCSIPGQGAVYKNGRIRDAIAILLPPSVIHNGTYGEISAPEQSYIVNRIGKLYSVYLDNAIERDFLKTFMQRLQDAHDNAFDGFNHVEGDRMEFFITETEKIKDWLNAG